MSHVLPTINDSVEVIVHQDDTRTSCTSSVFDLVDGNFRLNWPTRDGIRVPVRKNQALNLVWAREDATYSMLGRADALEAEPFPTILFRVEGPVERVQRRDYCRVRASLPVLLTEAMSRGGAASGAPRGISITTRTIDISGSGMRIHVDSHIPAGTVFHVKLGLVQDEPALDLTARAVYTGRLPAVNGRQMYRIGLEFTAVPETKRRLIVRHVFKIQQASIAEAPEPQRKNRAEAVIGSDEPVAAQGGASRPE